MSIYTRKHFKKIWCLEHAFRELKKRMNVFEDEEIFEQLDSPKIDETKFPETRSIKRRKDDGRLKQEADGSCHDTSPFNSKYHKITSPIKNSPSLVFAEEYMPKEQHLTTSSPVPDEFHEVSDLDNSEASINIEPLTAVVERQHIVNSAEAKSTPASGHYKEGRQIDHLNSISPEDAWASKDSAVLVVLGPHGTTASADFMMTLDWSTGSQVTRKLLAHIFDRETLATHTLTGKPSPAFRDREMPDKKALDPLKVADIVHAVTMYTNCTARDVRLAITTKCADENKMLRKSKANKENMSPGVGKSGKSNASKKC